MTAEAALTKLSYLLANRSREEIKKLMPHNLCGELTQLNSHNSSFSLRDSEFLKTVASALNVSSSKV